MERTLENAVNAHLIGSFCTVEGTIARLRGKNPFTLSTRDTHQWMVLLKDVIIGGYRVDHIWLFGCKRIGSFRKMPVGTRVSLTGRVGLYDDHGEQKWTLKMPFRNVITGLHCDALW